ncbi:hypothetical protein BH23BAC1_BH23BAC1_11370 [soil metagenome]
MLFFSFIIGVILTFIHLFAYRLKFVNESPRSKWLSIAGGASVSYIFIHLMPELAEGQQEINQISFPLFNYFTHHIYLLSLIGLCLFYGLEWYIKNQKNFEDANTSKLDFWLHISSFCIYNFLIGYLLLHREEEGILSLVFFSLAMGFHFLVNDYGLSKHHKLMYKKMGRWILSLSILLGWGVGALSHLPKILTYSIIAFLAGGIFLNVLKEELPEDRKSNYWAFLTGAFIFTFVLYLSK